MKRSEKTNIDFDLAIFDCVVGIGWLVQLVIAGWIITVIAGEYGDRDRHRSHLGVPHDP